MNNEKNLPLEAEIISIHATAEEVKKLRADLRAKTTVISKAIEPNGWTLPSGPMFLNGQWHC